MYRFPEHFYSDIRIEDVTETTISYQNLELRGRKVRSQKGAFLRLFDGNRWYYASVTDLDDIQAQLDGLAAMATPNETILDHPVVRRFQVNRDEVLRYRENDVRKIPADRKQALLQSYLPVLKEVEEVATSNVRYKDRFEGKWFYSSLGANIHYDYQLAGVAAEFSLKAGDVPTSGYWFKSTPRLEELQSLHDQLRREMADTLDYAKNAVPVEPGTYTCVLDPEMTGMFAHESFGHKSESDFMLGSETMRREWALGSRVGSDILNIMDTGIPEGSGYLPYDDEGTKTGTTYLIKDGILTGRLHSATTAAELDEDLTGNARAVSFEFEPIVRMTSTYIGGGRDTFEELLRGAEGGIYLCSPNYGTGSSTFTMAPIRAYRIRDGKLAEPLRVSVVSGNVMETLHKIDGATKDAVLEANTFGGCGKNEQFPLRVSDGGPCIRVRGLMVQ